MGLRAGRLRFRVNFEERVEVQDPTTGAMDSSWKVVLKEEPVDILPVSVRDFIAAKADQSEITARIVVRWQPVFDTRVDGKPPDIRIVHGYKVYWPAGFLPDKEYGIEYVTAYCSEGVQYT